ncbi:hypothetical protein G7054_g5741 [Neopestalotiopsis clavispora]|nr:hypothetical protein G7054_g5741 [Neopestalotiopsis clavispora]
MGASDESRFRPSDFYGNVGGGYTIPNQPINSYGNRKIKVLGIGAGISGIMMAYKIQKRCTNVELKIVEKNPDIGGTWYNNRYPGCACDIPSHAYSFKWALYPDWPRFFSKASDIWSYLDKVCDTFGLRQYMQFNTSVVGCQWIEASGQWKVDLQTRMPTGEMESSTEMCDILLHSTGVLNKIAWPKIEGLQDFKGKIIHSADWPEDYTHEKWQKEKVAVIGSGATSIQIVPNMQPFVKHMDVFVRTAIWFVQIAKNYGQNHEYSSEERARFRSNPDSLVSHAKDIEDQVNGIFQGFFKDTPAQQELRQTYEKRMAALISDEKLRKGFTPTFGVGCRRVTPGDPYMEAIRKDNVDVHFTGVDRLTSTGVVGSDGVERCVDTIICATGFDVSFRPAFPLIGRNGVDLAEKWKSTPECYMGLTIPDFPNLITFIGPTWPISNGSCLGPLDAVGDYAVQAIHKVHLVPNLRSFAPRQDLTDAFNAHVQEWIKHTVWSEGCRSWYRNNDTGRVNAVWPGSSLHYIEAIKNVRWEDYEMAYRDGDGENPFSWLGMGFAAANRDEGQDRSPYFALESIDQEWWKAMSVRPDDATNNLQNGDSV